MTKQQNDAFNALWDATSELLEDPEASIPDPHRDALLMAIEQVQAAFPKKA